MVSDNVNVIALDWGPKALGASNLIYKRAAANVKPVGEHLANFIAFVVDNTTSTLEDFHLIGHSLGAHVAGCAGSKLNGSIARISGLGKEESEKSPHFLCFVSFVHF